MVEEREKQDELLVALDGIQKELNGIKKKDLKQVLQIIVAVVLTFIISLSAGIICGQHWDDIMLKIMPNSYSSSTTTILEEKLTKQAKLNTGLYEQTSTYDSGKIFDNKIEKKLNISKSMKFEYTGYVEAGIKDLSEAKINVNSKTNVITIENIKIDITNVYVDPSSITDVKQSKNIFNQLTVEDFAKSQKQLQDKLIKDAMKSKIIKTAQDSAEEMLTKMFGESIKGYTVEFKWD